MTERFAVVNTKLALEGAYPIALQLYTGISCRHRRLIHGLRLMRIALPLSYVPIVVEGTTGFEPVSFLYFAMHLDMPTPAILKLM